MIEDTRIPEPSHIREKINRFVDKTERLPDEIKRLAEIKGLTEKEIRAIYNLSLQTDTFTPAQKKVFDGLLLSVKNETASASYVKDILLFFGFPKYPRL